jgi:hypothetical protein
MLFKNILHPLLELLLAAEVIHANVEKVKRAKSQSSLNIGFLLPNALDDSQNATTPSSAPSSVFANVIANDAAAEVNTVIKLIRSTD